MDLDRIREACDLAESHARLIAKRRNARLITQCTTAGSTSDGVTVGSVGISVVSRVLFVIGVLVLGLVLR